MEIDNEFGAYSKLIDAKSGEDIAIIPECCGSVFSPDSHFFCIAYANDNGLKIYNIDTLQSEDLGLYCEFVSNITFNVNEEIFTSGSADGTITLWNLKTGEKVKELKGHEKSIKGFAYSFDGKRLASCSTDNTIRIWDIESGKELKKIKEYNKDIKIKQIACKKLCPMIENNWQNYEDKFEILNDYIKNIDLHSDTLILACTHYPLIIKDIKKVLKQNKNNIKNNNFYFPDLKRGQDPVFLADILTHVDKIPVIPIDLYGFRYAATGGLSKINTYEKKYDYIKHFKDTLDILHDANFNKMCDRYQKKLFEFIL